jgi:hypothetical protein
VYLTEAGRAAATSQLLVGAAINGAGGSVEKIRGTLRAVLSADLDREARLYTWSTYGDDGKVLAGNDTQDIAFRVDPAAWFVALELQLRTSATARNLLIQVFQDGDRQLFRTAVPLSALVTAAQGARTVFPLPREWPFRPGSSGVIRLQTRTAAAATVDACLAGYRVRIA